MSAYSKGMCQKILLAAALLHNPDLILLDEPFSGLDVGSALLLRDIVRGLALRGKTVLLSSHEMDTIERVCSRVIILNKGRVVADDSIEQLRTLMALPSLERIFSQLALEQDTETLRRNILDVVGGLYPAGMEQACDSPPSDEVAGGGGKRAARLGLRRTG